MSTYEKFTYDLGDLRLSKTERAKLEKDFEGTGEYLVCSDGMADEQVKDKILSSMWTFSPDFLSKATGIEKTVFRALSNLNEKSNDAITALVRSTCGIDSLVEQAISSDGRGQYLASYDGEEVQYVTKSGKTVYIYRCN
jgi:hypothetical protein